MEAALLRALVDVARSWLDSFDPERILGRACDTLAALDGWSGVFVILLDQAGQPVLSAHAGRVEGFPALLDRIRSGEVPACWRRVQVTDRPVTLAAGECSPPACPIVQVGAGLRARLHHGRSCRGLIGVLLDPGYEASDGELDCLREVSEILSLALARGAAGPSGVRAATRGGADRLATIGSVTVTVVREANNALASLFFGLDTLRADLPAALEALACCREALALGTDPGVAATHPVPAVLNELGESLDDVVEAALRVRVLARDLDRFARVRDDELAAVVLEEVLESAANLTAGVLRERCRLLRVYGDVPPVGSFPGWLTEAFVHLLDQASRSLDPPDSEGNELRIRTWAEAGEVRVELTALPAAQPDEADGWPTPPPPPGPGLERGTALGVPIARSIVEALGGRLEIDSSSGQATRFLVRLPAHEPPAPEPEVLPEPDPPARGRVLVVEDDPKVRSVLAHCVGSLHEVAAAGSGDEARDLLTADPGFDAVVCDLLMDNGSGMDLHAWLQASSPALAARMVFVTGGAFCRDVDDFLARVGNPVLLKPIEPADLLRHLDGVLRRRDAACNGPSDMGP